MTGSHPVLASPPPEAHRATSAPEAHVTLDLQLLVTFAARAISSSEHRIHCGLTVTPSGRAPETLAATDDLPVRADWLQHELRQGPDFAPSGSDVVMSKDLAADLRWPDFGRWCVAVMGMRSMVSILAPTLGIRTTLNFFSSEPAAFDHLDAEAGLGALRLATPVAQAVIERLGLSAKRPCRQTFESNLGKLPVALGIVMSQYRVNSSDGFSLLCVAAADHGCPLFDFAVMVVKKGRLAEGEMLEPCPAGSRSVLPQPGCSLGSFREAGWLDPRPRREPPLATPCR